MPLCVCEQCWQQQTDVVGGWEVIENMVFQNCKRVPLRYYQIKEWIAITIFIVLKVLDTAMDVQSRNILFFVDTCVTFLQDMSFLSNVKIVYHPPTAQACYSVLM